MFSRFLTAGFVRRMIFFFRNRSCRIGDFTQRRKENKVRKEFVKTFIDAIIKLDPLPRLPAAPTLLKHIK